MVCYIGQVLTSCIVCQTPCDDAVIHVSKFSFIIGGNVTINTIPTNFVENKMLKLILRPSVTTSLSVNDARKPLQKRSLNDNIPCSFTHKYISVGVSEFVCRCSSNNNYYRRPTSTAASLLAPPPQHSSNYTNYSLFHCPLHLFTNVSHYFIS